MSIVYKYNFSEYVELIAFRGVATGDISVYIPSQKYQNQSLKIILCTNCSRCRPAASI